MKPTTPDRDRIHAALDEILDSGQLTNNGKYVRMLEGALASLHFAKHAICINNATTGLMMAAAMLPKGEVIMPAFTFVATASAFAFMGHTPVFCDIGLDHNIDADKIQALITSRTVAIVGVHLWGNLCDVEKIERIARLNDIKVIYDAAHAFGQKSPSLSIYSLHATKVVHSFEGGFITTNDTDTAEHLRLMGNFGLASRHDCRLVGINAKMSEIHAATGIANLKAYSRILQRNYHNWHTYRQYLNVKAGHNRHYIILECDSVQQARDIEDMLSEHGHTALRYFDPPLHKIDCYPDASLPVTEALSGRVLVLPNERCEEVAQLISPFLS